MTPLRPDEPLGARTGDRRRDVEIDGLGPSLTLNVRGEAPARVTAPPVPWISAVSAALEWH